MNKNMLQEMEEEEANETPEDEAAETPAHQRLEKKMGVEKHGKGFAKKAGQFEALRKS